jgi:hypothetical protein
MTDIQKEVIYRRDRLDEFFKELGIRSGPLGPFGHNSLPVDILEMIKYEYKEDEDAPYGYKMVEAILREYNGASLDFDTIEMCVDEIPPIPDNKYHDIGLYYFVKKIHNIPKGLTRFRIKEPLLTELPELPEGLEHLDIYSSTFSTLPKLPASIMHLIISVNHFTVLPDLSHFEHLQELECACNQLYELPALPPGLLSLVCSGNQLKTLPALPTALANLECDRNQLEELPALQHCSQLWSIDCSHNSIRHISTELPDSLVWFEYSNNPIETPPERVYKKRPEICPRQPEEAFTVRKWKPLRPPTSEHYTNNAKLDKELYPKVLEHVKQLNEEIRGLKPGTITETLQK